MSAQHTPAPWSVEVDHSSNSPEFIRTYVDGEMYDLASVLCDETGNATANARLIAAAPDLLAAAQCALADFEGILPEFDPEREHPAWETLAELRAAITKATGETA